MIKRLKIKNFQSHEESTLRFSPGVNVIVGSSDSGKSAIIRALRWVVYGKPRGDSFCSWWGGETKVVIDLDELRVIRTKDKSKNTYTLVDKEKNSKVFHAIGNDIPEEIAEALNFDEINIQRQGDKPFLFSETSGEVAQHFNRMAQLEKIDTGRRYIESELRATIQQITFKNEEQTRLKEEYKKYNYLPTVEAALKSLQTRQALLEAAQKKKTGLQVLLNEVEIKEKAIKAESYVLRAEQEIGVICALVESKNTLQIKKNTLSAICDNITDISFRIEKGIRFTNAGPAVDNLIALYEKKTETVKNKNNLRTALQAANEKTAEIGRLTNSLSNWENEYSREMPEICPFCERKIDTNETHNHTR